MNKTKALTFFLLIILFTACDDEATPEPATRQIRPYSMSYDQYAYRILGYNGNNQVTTITNGTIVNGDSSEIVYDVIYSGGRVDKIVGNNQEIDYLYNGEQVSETNQYINGRLAYSNIYIYDTEGRVMSWTVFAVNDNITVPLTRTSYAYRSDGNLETMNQYLFHSPTRRYISISTVELDDYDDKKNSYYIFFSDLSNVYHQKFKNNPRLWRISNNGSGTTEERFVFEYNAEGYTTRESSALGDNNKIYRFEKY
jgi:hypothetical protein